MCDPLKPDRPKADVSRTMPRHGPLTRDDARAILEVSVGATRRELTAARNRMHKQYHPDRPGGDTRLAQRINEAFDVLLAELATTSSYRASRGACRIRSPACGTGRAGADAF